MLAHRISFALEHGELPEAVCHTCDNPSCVNPIHLFAGTRADNNKDMMDKGRHWSQTKPEIAKRGSNHANAKLTEQIVTQIRNLYETGLHTQRYIARQYSVSQRTINKIVNEIGWKHVNT